MKIYYVTCEEFKQFKQQKYLMVKHDDGEFNFLQWGEFWDYYSAWVDGEMKVFCKCICCIPTKKDIKRFAKSGVVK